MKCMKLDACLVNSVIFVFSRNFPEIAWRAFKAARRLMLFCGVCGFQRWNRLAALLYPPGDAWRLTQFSGFLLELPGGKDQPPGDANIFPRFCLVGISRLDFVRLREFDDGVLGHALKRNQKCAISDTARGGDYRLQGYCDSVSKALGTWRYASPRWAASEQIAPSDLCPPLGDLAVLSSKRIPSVELGIVVKHVAFLELSSEWHPLS
ncbi:hypothetical protein DEO72_LG5g934 [Vigna unguiculata]|uniref:Uncharacterized protein n=1 Tax=Vigna unguiculata TaxID=3917 RepID=A0A4D6LW15_VIGUN|nr:hypothetical protein DEO72_LG5g934 [Vigna unguiculata]